MSATVVIASLCCVILPMFVGSYSVEMVVDGEVRALQFEESDNFRQKAVSFVTEHELHKLRGSCWSENGASSIQCVTNAVIGEMRKVIALNIAEEANRGMRYFEVSKSPQQSLIVIDNFMEQPYALREFGLACDFIYKGNHPGKRSASFANLRAFRQIRRKIELFVGERLPYWFASFQRSGSNDTDNGVHRDYPTYKYSAVLYLSPDAPVTAGTSTYQHRQTGLFGYPSPEDALERNTSVDSLLDGLFESPQEAKHHEIDRIGNRFNRLLIFNSRLNHRSSLLGGLGPEEPESRLVLILFFNSEDPLGYESSLLWHDQVA